MKILMVTSSFPPDQYGGLESAFHNLYQRARQYHEVQLLTGWKRTRSMVPPEALVVPLSDLSHWRVWIRLSRKMNQTIESFKPDIIICSSIAIPHVNIPTICLWQEETVLPSILSFRLRLKMLFQKLRIRNLYKVVVPSHNTAERLKKMGLDYPNIQHIPNGIDLDYFRPLSKTKNSQKITIVLPGRFKLSRGQHIAIDIIARLPKKWKSKVQLVLAGSLEDRVYLEQLRIQSYKQPVAFAVDVPDMKDYYQLADIVISTTLNSEGLSNALLEAMACGCPIMWFDIPSVRDSVGGTGVFVEKGDVEQFAKQLLHVLENKEERDKMSLESRRYVQQHYNWKQIWTQFELLFQGVRLK
jgi:glycosyltransferase involved in cell wall biosynthesis